MKSIVKYWLRRKCYFINITLFFFYILLSYSKALGTISCNVGEFVPLYDGPFSIVSQYKADWTTSTEKYKKICLETDFFNRDDVESFSILVAPLSSLNWDDTHPFSANSVSEHTYIAPKTFNWVDNDRTYLIDFSWLYNSPYDLIPRTYHKQTNPPTVPGQYSSDYYLENNQWPEFPLKILILPLMKPEGDDYLRVNENTTSVAVLFTVKLKNNNTPNTPPTIPVQTTPNGSSFNEKPHLTTTASEDTGGQISKYYYIINDSYSTFPSNELRKYVCSGFSDNTTFGNICNCIFENKTYYWWSYAVDKEYQYSDRDFGEPEPDNENNRVFSFSINDTVTNDLISEAKILNSPIDPSGDSVDLNGDHSPLKLEYRLKDANCLSYQDASIKFFNMDTGIEVAKKDNIYFKKGVTNTFQSWNGIYEMEILLPKDAIN